MAESFADYKEPGTIIDKLLKRCNNVKKRKTQFHILFLIFKQIGYDNFISKSDLEWNFTMRYISDSIPKDEHDKIMVDINDKVYLGRTMPGDVQRQIRSFYDKFKCYGLEQRGSRGSTLGYIWNSEYKFKDIDHTIKVSRNLYKNKKERDTIIKERGEKCEVCSSTYKICIDHWRSHSIYKIEDRQIAVCLCEKCNNIHSNKDSILILKKYRDNIAYILNWINIENEKRNLGYLPNFYDILLQNETINNLVDYHKSISNYCDIIRKLESMKIISE